MELLKKNTLWAILMVLLMVPQPVRAGGIPVIDIAGLAQAVMDYVQNILDYYEQVEQLTTLEDQLGTMDDQYATQIQQYLTQLEEYEHYLNQLEKIGTVLEAADWNSVMSQSATYYGSSDWSSIPNINIVTEAGAANLKTIVETGYELPLETAQTISTWQTQIPDYEMPEPERAAEDYNAAQMAKFVDRQEMVANNQAAMNTRSDDLDKIRNTVLSLPNDSELQTLQMISQQLLYMMQQQEVLMGQQNQLLSSQETMSEFVATQDAEAKRIARENIKQHRNNLLPSTLGSDLWKQL